MRKRHARGDAKAGGGVRKESSFPWPLAASTIARAFSRGSSSLAQIGELARRLKNMRLKGLKLRHQPFTKGFV